MTLTPKQIGELHEAGLEMLTEHDVERQYRDSLDEAYPDLTIAGYSYSTSNALANVDPTAYRCGLADYISAELEERLVEVGDYYCSQEEVQAWLDDNDVDDSLDT